MTFYKKAMQSVASSIVYDFGKRHIICYKGLGLVASVWELHHTKYQVDHRDQREQLRIIHELQLIDKGLRNYRGLTCSYIIAHIHMS